MSKETVVAAEARQVHCVGRLPIFEQIAQGFLENLANDQHSGASSVCLSYLDAKVKIDGVSYTRRNVVLAIEDLKQQIEAPLPLQCETCAQMKLLRLDPVPEMKLYRDVATAILRIDAALHFSQMSKAQDFPGGKPIYH